MGVYLSQLFLRFIIYSVLGWVCEMLYCFAGSGKVVNRGFLKGPYCPVYGIGSVIMVQMLDNVNTHPLLALVVVIVVSASLEYFTSWLLEAMFGIRWWDYSKRRFNLNGRICLKNSLLFGVLGMVLVYIVDPRISGELDRISYDTVPVLTSLIFAVILLDLLTTLGEMQIFSEKITELQNMLNDAKKDSALISKLDEITTEGYLQDKLEEVKRSGISKLESTMQDAAMFNKLLISRLAKSFPDLYPRKMQISSEELSKQFEEWAEDIKRQRKEKRKRVSEKLSKPGVKGMIASAREYTGQISFYKLFWVFVIACVLGFVVETFWCLFRNGYIESRQGFLYGPFSHVYGLGAIVMVLALSPLAKKSDRWIFAGSAIIGGAFEWLCSWFQETVFGTVSWEYSSSTVPIGGGRTSLTYMFFWGILGIAFIKGIYPKFSQLIDYILNARKGLVLTWLLIIFIAIDAGLSATAVYRWSERDSGLDPSNAFEMFLDVTYPDEIMQNVYPNMVMKKAD